MLPMPSKCSVCDCCPQGRKSVGDLLGITDKIVVIAADDGDIRKLRHLKGIRGR